MKKPEKKEIIRDEMGAVGSWTDVGYNAACDDWEEWLKAEKDKKK